MPLTRWKIQCLLRKRFRPEFVMLIFDNLIRPIRDFKISMQLKTLSGAPAACLVGENYHAADHLQRIGLQVQILVSRGDSRVFDHDKVSGSTLRTDKEKLSRLFSASRNRRFWDKPRKHR